MKRLFFALAGILILFAAVLFIYRAHQTHYFSCTAHFQVNNGEIYLRTMLSFTFMGKEGTVSLRGEVNDAQKNRTPLNRLVFFSFTEKDKNYKLYSVNISKENTDRTDDALLKKLLYSFYLEKNKMAQYKIIQQKNADYVIYDGNLPLAYCHQNKY